MENNFYSRSGWGNFEKPHKKVLKNNYIAITYSQSMIMLYRGRWGNTGSQFV
jgi:hypothetical protein